MDTVVSHSQNLPVVVGVDRAREHLSIVDLGVAEARRRHAALSIVHVWPSRYSGWAQGRSPLPTEEDGRHLLELAARRARLQAPRLPVTTELLNGRASAVLAERSATARLLVVGHRDEALTHPSWGSTATYLAHQSACPLLVHRGNCSERGPVVVAASGHQPATATLACAYEEAARDAAHLVALHVSPASADRARTDRHLAEALAGWAWTYPDVVVERLIVQETEIGYTLQRAARRSRLLVAGMGRTGRFAEIVYGSLGDAAMRGTVCPVLLVPPGWSVGTERALAGTETS
ncbi:universal stress protein [Amorphoplanes nipponensis]|uniref:Universal stress protein n=1 Tax=Actinoplanes nipponensis TaxID=135950 RepID=A0A919JRK0_9ACTN|nr:universal stress protein [Actinoplanes nipponensis]GIE54145.1 universal stress protein [Actinoplanes nipponensis]